MENDPYILGSQYYQKKKTKASIFKGCINVIHQPGGPYWKKTVPEVLDQLSRQRARFFPIRTKLSWCITFFIFFSGNLKECLQKEPK